MWGVVDTLLTILHYLKCQHILACQLNLLYPSIISNKTHQKAVIRKNNMSKIYLEMKSSGSCQNFFKSGWLAGLESQANQITVPSHWFHSLCIISYHQATKLVPRWIRNSHNWNVNGKSSFLTPFGANQFPLKMFYHAKCIFLRHWTGHVLFSSCAGSKPSVWFSWYHLWSLFSSFLDFLWSNSHRQGCD